MKKVVWASALLSALAYSDIQVEEFLYKDPRVMGMGGASVAIGGYSTAVFSNPAGIINIKTSHGVEVDLLGITLTGSKDIQDLMDDIDGVDTDNTDEITDVIEKYSGKAFNANVSNYSSVSYHSEKGYAFSVGVLAGGDVNLIAHQNGGPNGLMEVHGRAFGGVVGAYAKQFDDLIPGSITFGGSMKYITQKSYDVGLDAGAMSKNKDNLDDYIQDNYEQSNSGFAIDLGAIYKVPDEYLERAHGLADWNPEIGVSLMNLGSLSFDDAYGAQPITFNLGVAFSKEFEKIDRVRIGIDYIDLFNGNQALIGSKKVDGTYKNYKYVDGSYSFSRHLRMGVSADLVDNRWAQVSVATGLYQGSLTFGIDMQLAIFKIQAATYEENMAGGSDVDGLKDRRYTVLFSTSW